MKNTIGGERTVIVQRWLSTQLIQDQGADSTKWEAVYCKSDEISLTFCSIN